MKKTILSMVTVMVLGTTVCFGTSTRLSTSSTMRLHGDDDKTQQTEQVEKCHCDGKHKGGPRRPPRPRIQPTEGCKCNTCEQIRKMEKEMQQHMEKHGMQHDSIQGRK